MAVAIASLVVHINGAIRIHGDLIVGPVSGVDRDIRATIAAVEGVVTAIAGEGVLPMPADQMIVSAASNYTKVLKIRRTHRASWGTDELPQQHLVTGAI